MSDLAEVSVSLFERFWAAYPRKVGKGAAIKAWEKLKPDDALCQKMILAIDAQKRYRRRVESMNLNLRDKLKHFIPSWPHPGTWLNGRRWEDEIESLTESKSETEEQKDLCPKCLGKKNYAYNHEQNPEKLCSWHFSEKHYNSGPTGLDSLRTAYKQRIPRLEGESTTDYLRRSLKTRVVEKHPDKRA